MILRRTVLMTLAGLLIALPATAQSAGGVAMKPYTESLEGTKVSIPMVPIPVGQRGYPKTFKMGSPESESKRGADEGPQVEVTVEPFWMGKFEITWDTYDVFRDEYTNYLDTKLDKASAPAEKWADAVSIPTPLWEQDSRPILMGLGTEGGFPLADISQYAARQFSKWLTKKTGRFYRLPTEAEWEYAARSGTTTPWSFGDDAEKLGDYAWNFDNSGYEDEDLGYPGVGAGYRKVGLKKPNPWGLHDMYGNVSEWVIDGWSADHYAKLAGKSVGAAAAIRWPNSIFPCVARGGNWESDPAACRSAARLKSDPEWQYRDPQIPKSIWWYTDAFHVGFRLVRPVKEPSREEKRKYWDPSYEGIVEILTEGSKQVRAVIDEK